jgi:hypothetical protein
LLAYVQGADRRRKSMKLLQSADTQEDQLPLRAGPPRREGGLDAGAAAGVLLVDDLRQQKYVGGHSFKNFVNRIREDAVATLTPEERTKFEPFLKGAQSVEVGQETAPRQFVRNWQMSRPDARMARATSGRTSRRARRRSRRRSA